MATIEENIDRTINGIDDIQAVIEAETGESLDNVPIERYVEILKAIFENKTDITNIYIGFDFNEWGQSTGQKALYFEFSDGSEKSVTLPDVFSTELNISQTEDFVTIEYFKSGVVEIFEIPLNSNGGGGMTPDGGEVVLPSIDLDSTLTQDGTAADAKAVGEKFAYVDESIENLENSLLEQINGLNDTVHNATEKVDGFEETVNNNTTEIESLNEQWTGYQEQIADEMATLDSKIPNVATVEDNILKVQHKEHIGTPTTLFSVELPANGGSDDLTDRFTTQAENEEPTYSEELASANGWAADGWTGDFANGFTNTSGNTNPLIFTMPEETAQNTYRIAFRCSKEIAPNALMVKCGGSELFDLYGQNAEPLTVGIVSVENGNVEFVPLGTFTGTITDISIKRVTGIIPTEHIITDSTGKTSFEIRTTKAKQNNIFLGNNAGKSNVSGYGCVALGSGALNTNTSGFWNIGIGYNTLRSNTVGSRNVVVGYTALGNNITGSRNIALGSFALNKNTTGNKNIAIGADSIDHNISGSENVGIGYSALYNNTTGDSNLAIGSQAIAANTTGMYNTAVGAEAMNGNTTGNYNVAIGAKALSKNGNASNNVAIGYTALYGCKAGKGNAAIGLGAGKGDGKGTFNYGVFLGFNTGAKSTTGADYNICIGYNAGDNVTTGANNICIGKNARTPTETTSNYLNIGDLILGSMGAADKHAKINGGLQLSDIPTTDPVIAGRVWNDNGTLKVSAG